MLSEHTSALTEIMTDLVRHAEVNRMPIIRGCASNLHHTVWDSSNVNLRGDLLAPTQLNILNRGNEPTFVTSNRREVLDLTLFVSDN